MIHAPSRGASQRLEPRPEPPSNPGHDWRSYPTAWGTIVPLHPAAAAGVVLQSQRASPGIEQRLAPRRIHATRNSAVALAPPLQFLSRSITTLGSMIWPLRSSKILMPSSSKRSLEMGVMSLLLVDHWR
jgi:hypothetical protein